MVSESCTNSTGKRELPRVDQPQAPNNVEREKKRGGKIQGDGRKFLDRFKSYSGSQISSPSLNVAHIYGLQPKSATKGDFFSSS